MSQSRLRVSLSPNVVVGNSLTFYLTYLGEAVDARTILSCSMWEPQACRRILRTTTAHLKPSPPPTAGSGARIRLPEPTRHQVWGTRINQQYSNNANWTLTSPPVFIGSNFVLEFYHKFDTEQNYDGGNVKISTNNGVTWTLLTPENGYTTKPVRTQWSGYSGNSGGWTQARFSLTAYPNQTVRFRWTFASDGSVRQGWYLDDVQTTGFILS